MRLYPAIRAKLGDWNYYIVRMGMKEIAQEVQLAHDFYEDQTLSEAVQRTLGEKRVKEEIVGYLADRPDRFFSSIVVAAMDGRPLWTPIEINENAVPAVIAGSKSIKESFGLLSFDEEPKYYALDGQHRVAAIKLLVSGNADKDPPSGFYDDLLSVIVVLREEHDVPEGEWLRRYRRLFSSLNRYAKPTDKDTNIIMDEDDLFAILTRRIITDHEFFQAPGPQKESFKVLTKGKNLRKNAPHFTTLQTLYEANEILLKSRLRGSDWYRYKSEKQFRPDEDEIDDYYKELSNYWDAILEVLTELRNHPLEMRVHNNNDSDDFQDHLVFWPIGQLLFIKLVRALIDDKLPRNKYSEVKELKSVLSPIKEISWDLHDAPWRHFLLVKNPITDKWRMRNEDRKKALEIAYQILRWILNLDPLNELEEQELRKEWEAMLYITEPGESDELWDQTKQIRQNVISST